MKSATTEDINNANLVYVSKLLSEINYVAFYGTLLGLVRDGSTIPGDDDIDIVIHESDREPLIRVLLEEKNKGPVNGLEITYDSRCFIQVARQSEHGRGLIDFYVCASQNLDLCDEWSFWGESNNKFFSIKFPTAWLDETEQINLLGSQINISKDYDAVLRFLYGSDWKRPRAKGKDYVVIPWLQRPITLVRPFVILGRIYNKFLSYWG